MPVLCQPIRSSATITSAELGVGRPTVDKRPHQNRVVEAGHVSEEYYGLVNTPASINKAMKILLARAALEKE